VNNWRGGIRAVLQRCGPFLFVWGRIILSAVIVVLVVVWLLAILMDDPA
jgi:hypothetical protein